MHHSKSRILLSALFAMLVYFVPNLVQDIHRIWGHHEVHYHVNAQAGLQFQNQTEKCPVCVFEFNIVDEPNDFKFIPLPQAISFIISVAINNQFQNRTFQYYQLRAPPSA